MTAAIDVQPLTGCLPWCRTDDPLNHSTDDDGNGWAHCLDLAEGAYSDHYGPIYTVGLQYDTETRLYVTVAVSTLTADRAEVVGRALLEGAAALRASGDTVAKDNWCPSYEGYRIGWVHVPPTVFEEPKGHDVSERIQRWPSGLDLGNGKPALSPTT